MSPAQFYSLIGSVFGYTAEYGPRFHAGQDYPWGAWTEIPSPGSGRVVARGVSSEAGNWVSIIIGSLYFIFYHMVQPTSLSVGQLVPYGSTVGYVGQTGNVTGNHLHLAVSTQPYPGEGNRQDPRPIVAALIASNGGSTSGGGYTPYPEDDMPFEQAQISMLLNSPAFDGGPTISELMKRLDLNSPAYDNGPTISQVYKNIDMETKAVTRDGKLIPVRQDNADTNTLVRQILARPTATVDIDALAAAITAKLPVGTLTKQDVVDAITAAGIPTAEANGAAARAAIVR